MRKRIAKIREWHANCFSSATPVITPLSGGFGMMVSPKQLLTAALGIGSLADAQSKQEPMGKPKPNPTAKIFRRKDAPEEIYVYSSDDMIDLVIRNYGSASLTEDLDPRVIDFLGSIFEAVMQDPYAYIDSSLIGGDELCVINTL